MTTAQIRQSLKLQHELNLRQGNVDQTTKSDNYNLRLYFYKLRISNIDLETCLDLCCDRFYFPNRQSVKPIVNDLIETLDNFDLIIEQSQD